jgi:homoserine O-succinyltransferase
VFSCLASHAAVLHFDGIERRRLEQKCFGMFEHRTLSEHPLALDLPCVSKIAHSRWNDVGEVALRECGYRILATSNLAGVGIFARDRRNPLLFFQGHPEYDTLALWREYRRDARRYLMRERDSYPSLPHAYFDARDTERLLQFAERAAAGRESSLLRAFPEVGPRPGAGRTPVAKAILGAWLSAIVNRKTSGEPPRRVIAFQAP